MKFSLNKLVVATAMALPMVVMASTGGAGLIGGRHDFATRTMFLSSQTLKLIVNGATVDVALDKANAVGLCSYCHTPHVAQTTALLWNRKLSTTASYTWDAGATTIAGTPYATIANTYNGPTAKCLSCHDASVSIGDVGNYMEANRLTTAKSLNTYKVGDQDPVDLTVPGAKVTKKVGAGGVMNGSHPVGMPYPAGVASQYNSVTTGASIKLAEFVANPVNQNGTAIKLYNDSTGLGGAITAGIVSGKTGIECSSCHDVHNKDSVDDVMLRGMINGSKAAAMVVPGDGGGYICLQCHTK